MISVEHLHADEKWEKMIPNFCHLDQKLTVDGRREKGTCGSFPCEQAKKKNRDMKIPFRVFRFLPLIGFIILTMFYVIQFHVRPFEHVSLQTLLLPFLQPQ